MRSFCEVPTFSTGKNNVVRQANFRSQMDGVIPSIKKEKIKSNIFVINTERVYKRKKKAIYLVGAADGLERHIQEALSAAPNIKEENHIIVERDKKTYKGLVNKGKKVNFKGKIFHGDMVEIAKETKGLGYVDFDGVQIFGEPEKEILRNSTKNKVDQVKVTVTSRGKIPEDKQSHRQNILDFLKKEIKTNYKCYVEPYRGRGKTPMIQIHLNKIK